MSVFNKIKYNHFRKWGRVEENRETIASKRCRHKMRWLWNMHTDILNCPNDRNEVKPPFLVSSYQKHTKLDQELCSLNSFIT